MKKTEKKSDTWMPLYIGDYLGDTSHLTTEQHGAYLLILMALWKRGAAALPDVDENLASAARLPLARWKAIRPLLIDGVLLRSDGKTVTQKRLHEELTKAEHITEARATAGAKGGATAAAKRQQTAANGVANEQQNSTPSQSQSQEEKEKGAQQPPKADTRADTEGHEPTPAGRACRVMRQAGLAATNPGDPRLIALCEQGATEAEFSGLAAEAVAKGKGFAWVLVALQGRRADAAIVALASPPAPDWRDTRDGVVRRGCELGIGPYSELDHRTGRAVPFETYRRRVLAAHDEAAKEPTT